LIFVPKHLRKQGQPKQLICPLRACAERRKGAERKKKEENGAKGERSEEEHYV
jgi:hypothetical protein